MGVMERTPGVLLSRRNRFAELADHLHALHYSDVERVSE